MGTRQLSIEAKALALPSLARLSRSRETVPTGSSPGRGDLAGGVYRDVDPAAFERADVIAAFADGGETNPTLGSLATIARTLRITTSKLLEGWIKIDRGC